MQLVDTSIQAECILSSAAQVSFINVENTTSTCTSMRFALHKCCWRDRRLQTNWKWAVVSCVRAMWTFIWETTAEVRKGSASLKIASAAAAFKKYHKKHEKILINTNKKTTTAANFRKKNPPIHTKINQVPFESSFTSTLKKQNKVTQSSCRETMYKKSTYCYCDLSQDVLLDGFAFLDDLLVEFIQRRVHQFHADPNIPLETQCKINPANRDTGTQTNTQHQLQTIYRHVHH